MVFDFTTLRSRLALELMGEKCEVLASSVVRQVLDEAGVKPCLHDLGVLLLQFDSFIAGYELRGRKTC